MTEINPVKISITQPLTFEALERMDDNSIWTKFDTDNSGTITDKEIKATGCVGQMFNDIKEFLLRKFGSEKITNNEAGESYFDYDSDEGEILTPTSLEEIPQGSHPDIREARNCDISHLNLSEEELLNLCIDKTTILSPEQKAIVEIYTEKMKDPGLGIRALHEQGFTGKGVRMAIIDQPLGKHQEYSDNIESHTNINVPNYKNWGKASMHGAGVTSIAVGKTTGVAPDAKVDYYSAHNLTSDFKASSNQPYVDAINMILDKNETLPEKDRVSVVSISWGFNPEAPGFEELQQAIKRAKEQGVFIVSTALERDYGMDTCGANRNPKADPNDPNSYEAGAFFKEQSETEEGKEEFKNTLLVPMDHRTVADYTDGESYRYEGNDGGMSWSTPWLAGMYVLAKQADPNITPERFWEIATETSDECKNNDTGTSVGRLINPQKLIDKIREGN